MFVVGGAFFFRVVPAADVVSLEEPLLAYLPDDSRRAPPRLCRLRARVLVREARRVVRRAGDALDRRPRRPAAFARSFSPFAANVRNAAPTEPPKALCGADGGFDEETDETDDDDASSASSFEEVTETDDDACEIETSSSSSSDRSRAADPIGGRATNPLSALPLIQ